MATIIGTRGLGTSIGAAPAGLGSIVFKMELAGFEPVSVSLSRFGERIRDFRPFWREYFAPAFYRLIQRNFELEGDYVGRWAPLSPAYAKWKQQHYPGKTILRRTDRLFRSLTFTNQAPGPEGIFIAEPQRLVLGTRVPYAQYHQAPGSFRSRGLLRALRARVARRFLFLPPKANSMFGRLLHEFAYNEARDAGLRVGTARATATSGLL